MFCLLIVLIIQSMIDYKKYIYIVMFYQSGNAAEPNYVKTADLSTTFDC